MKYLITLAAVLLIGGSVKAEELLKVEETETQTDHRMLAGQNDFSKDYVEKVTDERAAEKARRAKDRKDHDKYLLMIDRSR